MTACSLAVFCNVTQRFLRCSPTQWGRGSGDLCKNGVDEPKENGILIPKIQEMSRSADSPERSQAPPWKFWRKLSNRRGTSEKKPGKSKYHTTSGGHRTEWTHPSHLDLGLHPPSRDDDAVPVTSGILPDVVDKAMMRRSNSLKAPPKPPRLFLFRSSSINHPRSSLDGGSSRNSVVDAPGGVGCGGGVVVGGGVVDVVAEPEPIYVNSAFGASLKTELSCNDRIIPPTVNNNNNYNEGKEGVTAQLYAVEAGRDMEETTRTQHGLQAAGNGTLPRASKTAYTPAATAVAVVGPSYHTLPTRRTQRNKAVSPDVTSSVKKVGTGARSRRRSSEKQQEVSRHKHIMHSALDLLCLRFDPFILLDDLQAAGVLTPMDVQAFRGHPDRKLICESLANAVGDGEYAHFTAFIQVLRANNGQDDVVRVLDAMRAVDRIVHHLPCPPSSTRHDDEDASNQILADEKMISYDVGYWAADGLSLKPLVELERIRPADRKRQSGLSGFSGVASLALSTDSSDRQHGAGAAKPGDSNSGSSSNLGPCVAAPVMITACITGHNLSGLRAVALADVVRQHDCILELRIGKTQLGSTDLVTLCGAMTHNKTLASLDIRLNTLDFVSASAVAHMLLKTQALRQLNLSSTGLDVAGCRTILSAVANNKTLTHLDMSFLDVGDAVCESVRDALKSSSCLQRLRLRSNNFSAAGCFAIAEGLNRNRSLLELDLSRNCIGDNGAEALAHYVPESCLQEVSLENCGVTAVGCDSLAQMITGSKRLRSLDLSVNFLGDAGVLRLAAALERSSVLQTVGLNMCGVTNDGFSTLLDVLEKNASIALLKLCYNRLGREFHNPVATSDNLRYRLRIVTSSKPKLKILLWGNSFDEA